MTPLCTVLSDHYQYSLPFECVFLRSSLFGTSHFPWVLFPAMVSLATVLSFPWRYLLYPVVNNLASVWYSEHLICVLSTEITRPGDPEPRNPRAPRKRQATWETRRVVRASDTWVSPWSRGNLQSWVESCYRGSRRGLGRHCWPVAVFSMSRQCIITTELLFTMGSFTHLPSRVESSGWPWRWGGCSSFLKGHLEKMSVRQLLFGSASSTQLTKCCHLRRP